MKTKIHHSVPKRLQFFGEKLMGNPKIKDEYVQKTIAAQNNCLTHTAERVVSRDYIQMCNLITSSNRQNNGNGDYLDPYGIIHCGQCGKAKEVLYTSVEMCNGEDVMNIKWRPLACDCELKREADFIARHTSYQGEKK